MTLFRTLWHRERPALSAAVTVLAAFGLIAVLVIAGGASFDHTLRTVTLGGALLGLVVGALGSFAVLRRQALLGDALSHAALPGVVLAFILQGRDLGGLLVGAAIASLLAMLFITAVTRTTPIKQDAAQGIALTAWFALGLMLLSYVQGQPDAAQAGLDKFIFGQAAALVQDDLWLIAGVGGVILGVVVLFWRAFKLMTFDPDYAAALGLPVKRLESLLSVLMVTAIVLGLQLAGVILMVGLLIAPAAAARQWTNRLGVMVVLSGVFGAFAGGAGALTSAADVNLPTGPLMIVMAFVVVVVSVLFAPQRGVLWAMLRQRRERHAAQYRHRPAPAERRAPSASSAD